MIATIDIKCTAAHPEFPLQKITAFKDGKVSLRIIDMPRKIGNWQINEVYVNITLPDNSNNQYFATFVKGVWVVTFPIGEVIGNVEKGYSIHGNGIDETNQPITNYILGVGDVLVLDLDEKIIPELQSHNIRIWESQPSDTSIGDAWWDLTGLSIKTSEDNIMRLYSQDDINYLINQAKEEVKSELDGVFLKKIQTQAETVKTNNRLTFTDRANKNTMVWDGRGEGFLEFHGATNGIEFQDNAYNEFHGGGIGVTDLSKYKVYSWDNGEGLNGVLGNIVVGGNEKFFTNDATENKAIVRGWRDSYNSSNSPHRLIKSISIISSPDVQSASTYKQPVYLKLIIKNKEFKSKNTQTISSNSTTYTFNFDNVYCPTNDYIDYRIIDIDGNEQNVKLRVDSAEATCELLNNKGVWVSIGYMPPMVVEYSGVDVQGGCGCGCGSGSDLHFYIRGCGNEKTSGCIDIPSEIYFFNANNGTEIYDGCIFLPEIMFESEGPKLKIESNGGFYAKYGNDSIVLGCVSGEIIKMNLPSESENSIAGNKTEYIELQPKAIASIMCKHNTINYFTIGNYPPAINVPTTTKGEVKDFEIWIDGLSSSGASEVIPLSALVCLPDGQEIKAKNGYMTIVHITSFTDYDNKQINIGSVGYFKQS